MSRSSAAASPAARRHCICAGAAPRSSCLSAGSAAARRAASITAACASRAAPSPSCRWRGARARCGRASPPSSGRIASSWRRDTSSSRAAMPTWRSSKPIAKRSAPTGSRSSCSAATRSGRATIGSARRRSAARSAPKTGRPIRGWWRPPSPVPRAPPAPIFASTRRSSKWRATARNSACARRTALRCARQIWSTSPAPGGTRSPCDSARACRRR